VLSRPFLLTCSLITPLLLFLAPLLFPSHVAFLIVLFYFLDLGCFALYFPLGSTNEKKHSILVFISLNMINYCSIYFTANNIISSFLIAE
jgi:hypothetical protein